MSDSDELDSELESKVVKWLTEQGYPLEMYATRVCDDLGFETNPAFYYYDPDSGSYRETDVLASSTKLTLSDERSFQIHLTIECKQSREKPWVAFTDVDPATPELVFFHKITPEHSAAWWASTVGSFRAGQTDYPLCATKPSAHSLARVSFSKSNEDAAYGALMSVTKAAVGVASWLDKVDKDSYWSKFHSVVIPVLLLDGPLFGCQLNDEGNLAIQRLSRCTLHWKNRIGDERMPMITIEIVTPDSLSAFLTSIQRDAVALVQVARQLG